MSVTIKKMAEICGVSRGTVDRVINHRGKVKPETEALVRKVAEELGYVPNLGGKALAARKRNLVVGVLLTSEGIPFFDEVLRGLKAGEKEFGGYGLSILLKSMHGYDAGQQCALLEAMRGQISALIFNPINDPAVTAKVDELTRQGVFIVTVNTDIEASGRACYVGSDYLNCGETACALIGLLTRGRAKVGLLAGSLQVLGHQQRVEGFKKALKKYPDMELMALSETKDDDILAYEETLRMLRGHPDINALFLASASSYGACRAIMAEGRAGDLNVISVDATPKVKEMMRGSVIDATIYQHPYSQGYISMKLVFAYLVNGTKPEKQRYILKNEIRILENI